MVYFLSDLHLGAAYFVDKREAEMRVVSFLESIRHDAEALYLMGDVLDYWFEYRTVVPRGYVRFFGALAALADSGVKITWYIGNHDIWLFDYLRDEIGIRVVDGWQVEEILGKRFFLSHGDGVGRQKASFRLIRGLFRNKVCQKLYSGIHPRWTIPFAHGWSNSSRMSGQGGGHKKKPLTPADIDTLPLAVFAREYYRDTDPTINYFVFGHLHLAIDEAISPTCRFIVLGDWLDKFTYGKFDGREFRLMRAFDQKNRRNPTD